MKRQADSNGNASVMEGNTPGASAGTSLIPPPTAPSLSSTTREQAAPSLFDPTHLPTLLPRILSLSQLVAQSSTSSDSLFTKVNTGNDATGNDNSAATASTNASTARVGPDVSLGASSEEDIDVALLLLREHHEAAAAHNSAAHKFAPTQLHANLVREAKELDEAFGKAARSVEALPGKDLDVEEQEEVIAILERYRQRQASVRDNFARQASTLLNEQKEHQESKNEDEEMEVA